MQKLKQVALFVFLIAAGMGIVRIAKADTVSVAFGPDSHHRYHMIYVFNLDKTNMPPSSPLTASAAITQMSCSNGAFTTPFDETITGTINNTSKNIYSGSFITPVPTHSAGYTAESTPGSYASTFNVNTGHIVPGEGIYYTYNFSYQIPYTVAAGNNNGNGNNGNGNGNNGNGNNGNGNRNGNNGNGNGNGNNSPVSCNYFTATPGIITAPQQSQLRWDCPGSTSCSIAADIGSSPGAGLPGPSGAIDVTPSENTTYALTCNSGAFSSQLTTQVIVTSPALREVNPRGSH